MENTKDTTQNRLLYDDCYKIEQNTENHSIFKYMTDSSLITKNTNEKPSFLNYTYILPKRNIEIESDLKGIMRNNSRCSSKKWQSTNPELK